MDNEIDLTYRKEIEDQALIFLREYAITAYLALTLSLLLVAITVYQSFPSNMVIIWILAVCVFQTISMSFRRWLPLSTIPHRRKLIGGMAINILEALTISSCLLFYPYIDDNLRMMMVAIIMIAGTAATVTTAGYLPFYLCIMLPNVITVAFAAAISPILFDASNVLYVIAIFSIFNAYPCLQMSRVIFHHFRDAFEANLLYEETNIELQQAVHEARLANRSKTRFLAAASHDLRQPINTLSLFIANLSLMDATEQQHEIIGHMNTAINNIDGQLEALLDVSKLDAGVVKVNAKDIDLIILLEDIVSSQSAQCHDGLTLKFKTDFDSVSCHTDPILFQRVINNLVSNAIKYTNVGRIDISLSIENSTAQVSIKDTGIGIEEDEVKRVFEEFYQIGNNERSEANGLGLGLSIVARLASLLKIQVNLKSLIGVGTQVLVRLPILASKRSTVIANDDDQAPAVSANDDHWKVIALDNESSILHALKGVIETMGHSVETFTDAHSALRAFATRPYDLALIDFRLPGALNGHEIIQKMRNMNSSAKFFLVTGDSNIKDTGNDCEIIYKPLTDKKLKTIFN